MVDDHALVRSAVCEILNQAEGIDVVGDCSDGDRALEVVTAVQPDVVLMDVHMPVMSGPAATSALLAKYPVIRVIMLTASVSRRTLEECAQSGAVGYLLKGDPPQALVDAVRVVAAGGTVWPESTQLCLR